MLGIILAHTVLASPFVVVTVGASLTGFDRNLMRATSILGAKPVTGFLRVMLPLILPGVLSGAAFAFVTSFDEVVVVQFLANAEQRTLPLEMFTGPARAIEPGDHGGRHIDDGPVDPAADRRQPARPSIAAKRQRPVRVDWRANCFASGLEQEASEYRPIRVA